MTIENFLEKDGYAKLLRYATMLTEDNREEAEDLVSTILTRAVERIEKGESPSKNIEGWLTSMLHNEFIDVCRKSRTRRRCHNDFMYWSGTVSYQPDLEPEPERPIQKLSLSDILSQFKPMDQDILQLVYLKEQSLEEVREVLKWKYHRTFTNAAFKMYLMRLREKARKVLTEYANKSDQQTPGKTLPETRLAA